MSRFESRKRAIIGDGASLDFPSIGAGDDADLSLTVPDAAVGDIVMVGAPALAAGLVYSAFVSAANTVTIRVANVTALAIDPAPGIWTAAVLK